MPLHPFVTPHLRSSKCQRCGHRVAIHAWEAEVSRDYHSQYAQGTFLYALRRAMEDCDQVLDYGAGRGWFLDACRKAGLRDLAAADISDLAVEAARAKGLPAIRVDKDGSGLAAAGLPFSPRVLTLLDVIEHFPPL